MAIIKWRKNEIILVDQSDGLIDAVNQHFLCNELEAKFDGKNTYIFKDPDPDLFEGLQEYLGFIGVKPDFDTAAKEQSKIIEQKHADFEQLIPV